MLRCQLAIVLVATALGTGCSTWAPNYNPYEACPPPRPTAAPSASVSYPEPWVRITQTNGTIEFPHYSIVVPPDRGWYWCTFNERFEGILVQLRHGPPGSATFQMQFMRNEVWNAQQMSWSEQQIADDYRGLEKEIMIEQGVKKGQYRLSDLVMGDEQVGENKFFTMKYTTSSSAENGSGELYLYFPRQAERRYFVVAHYSETLSAGAASAEPQDDASHEDFLQALKSLRVRE